MRDTGPACRRIPEYESRCGKAFYLWEKFCYMDSFKIFIVEDDKLYGEMLRHRLSLNPEHEVLLMKTGAECLKNLYKRPGMVSLDYTLPDMSGMEVIRKLMDYDPELPVV
ncbi:MAG: response regulator, partial [Bacteroidales bacterium]|nr:response regulator [Bacteroidales bacterium]